MLCLSIPNAELTPSRWLAWARSLRSPLQPRNPPISTICSSLNSRSSARCCSMGCVDQNAKGQNQYRRLLIHPFVQVTTEGHGGGRLRRGTQQRRPLFACFCIKVLSPDQREGRAQWHP